MDCCWLTGCSCSELLYSPWIPCLQGLVPVSWTNWRRSTQTTLVPALHLDPERNEREGRPDPFLQELLRQELHPRWRSSWHRSAWGIGNLWFPLCRKVWTLKEVGSPKYSCCPAKEHPPKETVGLLVYFFDLTMFFVPRILSPYQALLLFSNHTPPYPGADRLAGSHKSGMIYSIRHFILWLI